MNQMQIFLICRKKEVLLEIKVFFIFFLIILTVSYLIHLEKKNLSKEIKSLSFGLKKSFLLKIIVIFFVFVMIFLVNYIKNIVFLQEIKQINNILDISSRVFSDYTMGFNMERYLTMIIILTKPLL